jgi:hypothetical protein
MMRSRWTRWDLVGLVSVALVASLAACDRGEHQAAPQPSPSVEERAVRASTAPDGGVVRVAESGFTASEKFGGSLTLGVVLENTSRSRAVSMAVEISVLDSAGQPVQYDGMTTEYEDVLVLRPGERTAVGRFRSALRAAVTARMVQLEVKVFPSMWWPVARVRRVTPGEVRQETDSAGTTWVSYTVTSEYPELIPRPEVHAICRDQSRKIIGGVELTSYEVSWQPGRSEIRTSLGTWVNQVGASCAEVYGWPGPGTPGMPQPLD